MGLLDENNLGTTKDKCPKCKDGHLVERSGGRFIGCVNYPKCRFFYVVDNSYGETKGFNKEVRALIEEGSGFYK